MRYNLKLLLVIVLLFSITFAAAQKIDDSSQEIEWKIKKTGNERNLDVNYTILSDTSTQFCIIHTNKTHYKSQLVQGRDLKKMPVEDRSDMSFLDFFLGNWGMTLSKHNIDLDNNDFECFTVEYDNFETGLGLKIGWNSILIDSSASGTATSYGAQEHVCIDIYGKQHGAWLDSGADVTYGNRTVDAWGVLELIAGTMTYVNINCAPNGNLTVSYVSAGDIDMMYSNDNGTNWNGPITVEDDLSLDTFIKVASAVDSNSVIHYCFILNSADDLAYVNTSLLNVGTVLSTAESAHCDIEVNSTNSLFIPVTDTTGDDLDIMTRMPGAAWSARTSINDGLGTVATNDEEGVSIAINSLGDIDIVSIHSDQLQFCYSGFTLSFSCLEIDGLTSNNPNIVMDDEGNEYVFYQNDSGSDGAIFYSGSNDSDPETWEINRTLLHTLSGYASPAQSTFPTNNNITCNIHYVRVLGTTNDDVYYENITGLNTCPVSNETTCYSLSGKTLYVPSGCTYYIPSGTTAYV